MRGMRLGRGIRLGRCHVRTLLMAFTRYLFSRGQFNNRWPLYFRIYDSWIGWYPHEEKEEQRE